MVATPIKPQRLSARDDVGEQGDWGPIQIATPAIVGGVLLLALAVYIIWQRRPVRKHNYDYHRVRTDWVTKIERILVPRRMRQRVLHSSAPMTLDESMRLSGMTLDFRRSRQNRSDSSDSQTPLTSTSYAFDYPPNQKLSDSPPPIPKRRAWRWWWFFGSRPKEIKSAEPGSRWRIDGPDGSSTGHGHSSHGHEDYHARYVGILETMPEDPEEADDGVIRIGENFTSIASTPMTQPFPDEARLVRGMSTVPEHPGPGSFVARNVPAADALVPQSNSGTSVSSANRGLPPSYDISQSHTLAQYPSAEELARLARSESYIPVVIPLPSRTAMYSPSPRGFHGRELSPDSFLTAQSPMTVATSLY